MHLGQDGLREKLKSIRDKYNGSPNVQMGSRHTEVPYPLSQQIQYQPHARRGYDHVPFEYSPVKKERIHFERPKIELKCERAYSTQKLRFHDYEQMKTPLNIHQMTEAQIKRQDNFNHFICDLDQRIQEKQRKLCDKFKENQKIMRHFDHVHEDIQPKRVQRFASVREIKPQALSQRVKMDIIPRAAYQKSMNYKIPSHYHQNAQNQMPSRNYLQSKKESFNIMREDSKRRVILPNSAHDMIQKKLQGNPSMNKDGWSTSKLQNIQNRIQSVLKQVNK